MGNVMAAVAYLFNWLSGLIVFFISKEDKVAKFHGMQSILWFVLVGIISVVVFVITLILSIVLALVLGPLAFVAYLLMLLWFLVVLVVTLWTMWKAFNNEMYKLPLVGGFAEKWSA